MTNTEKKFIVLRGPPGSGKSYFIRHNLPDAFACSADDYFISIVDGNKTYNFNPRQLSQAHNWCFNNFKKAIDEELPLVVLDNTNIIREHYKRYVQYAREFGYEVYQKTLSGNYKNKHGVSPEAVEKMQAKFEIDTELTHLPEKE